MQLLIVLGSNKLFAEMYQDWIRKKKETEMSEIQNIHIEIFYSNSGKLKPAVVHLFVPFESLTERK